MLKDEIDEIVAHLEAAEDLDTPVDLTDREIGIVIDAMVFYKEMNT